MKNYIIVIIILIILLCCMRESFVMVTEKLLPVNWPTVVNTDEYRPYYYVDPTVGNRIVYDWRWN